MSQKVSVVAAIPKIRKEMVKLQRNIDRNKGIVMDGRDIGSVVFPDADLKLFLTASPEVRAKRRYNEMVDSGEKVEFHEVLENIKNQIKKERISLKQITNKKAKDILKKLGYNKYYEHIPFIKHRLGINPPVMSPEYEDKLCSLFMEIQKPYALFCPDHRTNFLNYYYTIYKLCEILEYNQFLEYFILRPGFLPVLIFSGVLLFTCWSNPSLVPKFSPDSYGYWSVAENFSTESSDSSIRPWLFPLFMRF